MKWQAGVVLVFVCCIVLLIGYFADYMKDFFVELLLPSDFETLVEPAELITLPIDAANHVFDGLSDLIQELVNAIVALVSLEFSVFLTAIFLAGIDLIKIVLWTFIFVISFVTAVGAAFLGYALALLIVITS